MSGGPDKIILCAALMHGTGMHLGSWLVRDGAASDYISPELAVTMARTAEEAKLHAVFFADGITNFEAGTDRPTGALDPTMILALMAGVTDRLGLVATASTTYSDPYSLARRFGSLDHLSHGRAGWNSVATFQPATGAQFGGGVLPNHADRYARAEEFIDVTLALWDSWGEGALVGDQATASFARADLVHEINHVGQHFSVKGPLPFPRGPQGRPVIFQAGSSEEGRDQAAKYADVVFTAQHLLDGGVEFRTDMRKRAAAYGREVKVLPGMFLHLGRTHEEAVARGKTLDDALGIAPELAKLAARTGVPVDSLKLDEKFPVHLLGPDEEFSGSVGFRRTLVNLAVKEDLTVRELVVRYGGGHHRVIGSPEEVADIMQEWVDAGAADGFNLMVDVLPSGLAGLRDLLVPELQRRGLFHEEYEHPTLRENLGLAPVKTLELSA